MNTKKHTTIQQNISQFPVAPPYEIVYRNEASPYPVGPHSHNAVELYFTLSDLPEVLLNDTVSMIPARTLIIIPTHCIHQLYHENNVKYERYILSIHTGWLKSAFCELPNIFSRLEKPLPLFYSPTESEKETLLAHFNKLLSYKDKISPDSLASLFSFLSFFGSIIKSFVSESEYSLPVSESQKKINNILAYIHEHIKEQLSVSDIANHFYLNPDYLARFFKANMHIPISNYIMMQRISLAETLLREGRSVTQVQEELSFSSYAYFFKTFQKYTGISPSKYGKQ